MKFDKLLKNKYLYYAAVALMVINVLGYVAMGSIECILVLGGAAYLAQHFTQNRTADIFIGLFVANILFGCGRLREGMKDGAEKAGEGAADLHNKAKVAAANGDHQKAMVNAEAADKINKAVTKCKEGEKMENGQCVKINAAM